MNLASCPWLEADIICHSLRLNNSFMHWTGNRLTDAPLSPEELAKWLFQAPFVLLSHGIESDPILNYANQAGLDLWETNWLALTQMPSRLTAEPSERKDRAQLLNQATQTGYLAHYQGIRISTTGRRFAIEDAEIWDVLDEQGQKCGQAAKFGHWQYL
ncbi:MEKHLA domain-containing protein [Acaryochloris sp. IP29b_bin.137]|uniref:MEKHLA domain-containing protein n=1 Tax=Acaryochloris sp. IP29b_bin.137 TaxID=2969217 RepID=UPI002626A12B|nr:MEKHLA domain-containing protein [Acaryochloris sp. IP29b_bin.137]